MKTNEIKICAKSEIKEKRIPKGKQGIDFYYNFLSCKVHLNKIDWALIQFKNFWNILCDLLSYHNDLSACDL